MAWPHRVCISRRRGCPAGPARRFLRKWCESAMGFQGRSTDPRSIPRAGSVSLSAVADDPELTERVRRVLEQQVDVVEKRMFGSIGFMVGGVLRVGVGRHPDHVMMARVPLADEAAALTVTGVKPAVMRGSRAAGLAVLRGRAVDTDEQLERWVAVGAGRGGLSPGRSRTIGRDGLPRRVPRPRSVRPHGRRHGRRQRHRVRDRVAARRSGRARGARLPEPREGGGRGRRGSTAAPRSRLLDTSSLDSVRAFAEAAPAEHRRAGEQRRRDGRRTRRGRSTASSCSSRRTTSARSR